MPNRLHTHALLIMLVCWVGACTQTHVQGADAGAPSTEPDVSLDAGVIVIAHDASLPPAHDSGTIVIPDAGTVLPDTGTQQPDAGPVLGACGECAFEEQQCSGDEGCVRVADCVVRTGCRGISCYLANDECMAVIDEYGGPTGLSAALMTQLQDCVDMMCP